MTEQFYLQGEKICEGQPYHYKGCGLDDIFLLNGVEKSTYQGEDYVSIRDIEGLHIAIGKHLVRHRKALSPKEIRFLRNTMDKSQHELAENIGNSAQSVARWEKGQTDMPGPAEKFLRAFFLALYANTPEELEEVKELLVVGLHELDMLDDNERRPVQFTLGNHWEQQTAA